MEDGPISRDLEREIRQQCSKGELLDRAAAQKMSAAMGYDFSRVRIHTDSAAHAFNLKLGARAFTIGNDIFFSRRAYDPHSIEGLRLIAHELVHVRQQNADACGARDGLIVLPDDDYSEIEADVIAEAALSGLPAIPRAHLTGVIQRRATLVNAANNLSNPLTAESDALRPKNCHEAVLGWVLTSLGYPRRWRLIRLAAARISPMNPPQFAGDWMWNNIYTGRQQVDQAQVLANAQAGDVLCSGMAGFPTHSMVVVRTTAASIFIRGFNNAGTFLHLIPQPQYMQYDPNDRDVAHNNMWNVTGAHPNTFGAATGQLFLVDNLAVRQNVAAAFPWESSQIPVRNGVRWHYNFFQGWRWF